jgi:hypothetical protein
MKQLTPFQKKLQGAILLAYIVFIIVLPLL